jgi:asparagine synthase (glutamine-hydrolysing)
MCGIAGIFNLDPGADVSRETVERMCAVIRHRGPDDQGVYSEGRIGLGARRLSIIDLVTGNMPIHNEDSTVWVVFNGEIYNFHVLRTRLESQGHRFYTNSDTEVLVHLYEEYDVDFVDHLRGMFAIALWDAKSQKLVLVRDRLGIKPLHYWVQANRVLFGSELKCLLQASDPKPAVNLQAVNYYLSLGYVPDPHSIFDGIKKLEPGHLMVCQTGQTEIRKYWELPWPHESNAPAEEECCERLKELLTESVKLRLVSDVPLGAFLSGGLDSSTVVALMAGLLDRPVKTFSIGFAEKDFSELGYARRVAQHYGTDHHELIVDPRAVQLAEHLAVHFDEPFGDPSAIPTYLVSKLAHESVTVALSGDGGDEMFAGYPRYPEARRQQVWDWVPRSFRQGVLLPLSRRMPHSAYGKRYLRRAALPDGLARYFECAVLPYAIKEQLVSEEFQDQIGSLNCTSELCRTVSNGRKHTLLEQILYLDTTSELPADILTKVDRMSMAHSLEVRVPLLDHVFVEYVARLPTRYKLRGQTMKYCFKKAFGPLLPDEILHRSKMGFGIPLRYWFAHDLHDFVRDVLFDSRAMQRGYFRTDFLEALVREHSNGRRDHSYLLWSLMALELWHRQAGL